MDEIIKLPGNVWETSQKYEQGHLVKRLQVNGYKSVFDVHAWRVLDFSNKISFLVTITTDTDGTCFDVEYTLGPYNLRPAESGRLSNMKSTSDQHRFGDTYWSCMDSMPLKLIFEVDLKALDHGFCRITGDLLEYINRGRYITLIGADGSGVNVRERLLCARSKALEAMFEYDSKEKQTGQIEMKDFDSKVLAAFVHFMEEGEIKDGKETALGLILLGDKYDIQYMMQEAEKYVRKNIKDMDQDEVLDIYHRVKRESLKEAMVGYWSKE